MSADPYAYGAPESQARAKVAHLLPVAMVPTASREAVENAYLTLRRMVLEWIVLEDAWEERHKWGNNRHLHNRDLQDVLPALVNNGIRVVDTLTYEDGCHHDFIAPAPREEWECAVKKLRGEIQLALAGPVNGGIQENWIASKNVRANKRQLREQGVVSHDQAGL